MCGGKLSQIAISFLPLKFPAIQYSTANSSMFGAIVMCIYPLSQVVVVAQGAAPLSPPSTPPFQSGVSR